MATFSSKNFSKKQLWRKQIVGRQYSFLTTYPLINHDTEVRVGMFLDVFFKSMLTKFLLILY